MGATLLACAAALLGAGLPTWNFAWTTHGPRYSAVVVGADPRSGAATTVPVAIFPVSLTCNTTTASALDPDALSQHGATVLEDVIGSPVFQTGVDFKSGGVDFGHTQYDDAWQRADFYGAGVKAHPGYHLTLGAPAVQKVIAVHVPQASCQVAQEFGVTAILVDASWYDANVVQPALAKVPAGTLAVFVTTQSFLTNGACCIGGYHSANAAGNTYVQFSYIQKYDTFAEDVSVLSLEIGNWTLDPLLTSTSPCRSFSVGNPVSGAKNFGNYTYTLGGFRYDLQDLATMPYFGAPPATSVHHEFSFHGAHVSVCQNGR